MRRKIVVRKCSWSLLGFHIGLGLHISAYSGLCTETRSNLLFRTPILTALRNEGGLQNANMKSQLTEYKNNARTYSRHYHARTYGAI
jgi:hypothetical protein